MAPVGTLDPDTGLEAPSRRRSATFAALEVPLYPRLLCVGFLWNLTRWMSMFLCSYLVNQLTHSPFMVQLVGTAFFTPMFLAGAVGGVISDRLDRRRTMIISLSVLLPVAAVMAVVNLAGVVHAWMVYPFMLTIGVGMVVEMTSRRALVYDLVGRERVTNALALELLASTAGTLAGAIGAGAIVSVLGIGQAFVLVAVFYCVSLTILVRTPLVQKPRLFDTKPDVVNDLKAGFAYLKRNPTLISVLGITVIVNLFYFAFTPMIPVFADHLGVNAFWTGVLASATAVGSLTGTLFIARGLPIGRGMIYLCGSGFALICLSVFAAADWYPLALGALVLAGLGTSGFATMQSVLVLVTTEDEMRGRAMGLLSMSIGALPFSTILLGAAAEEIGPSAAVISSVAIGFVLLIAWAIYRPQAHRLI